MIDSFILSGTNINNIEEDEEPLLEVIKVKYNIKNLYNKNYDNIEIKDDIIEFERINETENYRIKNINNILI